MGRSLKNKLSPLRVKSKNHYLFNILLDINECDEDSDGCAHQCTNTISSYYCSCNIGYSLDADDHGCTSEFVIIINI